LAALYRDRLGGLRGWTFAFAGYHGESSNHLAVLVAPDEVRRFRAVQALRDARIQTSLHYPSIPSFATFASWRADDLAKSSAFVQRAITLPLFPGLTSAQVEEVCAVIETCR